MKRMSVCRSILVLMFQVVCMGTTVAQPFSIEPRLDTSRAGTVYSFPVVTSGPRNVQTKINTFLQRTELELVFGEEDSSIFERIWPREDFFSGIAALDFEVKENSARILSIQIDREGCGAYCESYSTYYNFDASTGEQIQLSNIFSEAGLAKLSEEIVAEQKSMIAELIATADESESPEAVREMFQACLEFITSAHACDRGFLLRDGNLYFYGSRCSSHALLGLDELGEFEIVKSLDEVKEYLSEYGRKLLD